MHGVYHCLRHPYVFQQQVQNVDVDGVKCFLKVYEQRGCVRHGGDDVVQSVDVVRGAVSSSEARLALGDDIHALLRVDAQQALDGKAQHVCHYLHYAVGQGNGAECIGTGGVTLTLV